MLVPVVDGDFGGADRSCDGQVGVGFGLRDDGQSGSQGTTVEASVEDGGSQAFGRDSVAVRFGDSCDEAMQA